jgi:hypothetical protein
MNQWLHALMEIPFSVMLNPPCRFMSPSDLNIRRIAVMSRPYDEINPEQLQRDADGCLLTYGTSFYPEIITSTDGIYFETASGHRMMDVR